MSNVFPSRESKRRKPVKGGGKLCAHCDENREPGSSYCPEHRREYQRGYMRDWRLKQREEIAEFRQWKIARTRHRAEGTQNNGT